MKDSTKDLMKMAGTTIGGLTVSYLAGFGLVFRVLGCKNKATALAWLLGGAASIGIYSLMFDEYESDRYIEYHGHKVAEEVLSQMNETEENF